MPIPDMLKRAGTNYSLYRNEKLVATVRGIAGATGKDGRQIGFSVDADVKCKDILIDPHGDKYYVIDTQYTGNGSSVEFLTAICQSEHNMQSQDSTPGNTYNFNNGNFSGSIIGGSGSLTVNNHYTDTNPVSSELSKIRKLIEKSDVSDREAFNQIASILQEIADGQTPPKRGMLAEFSNLMESHSWFTGTMLSFFLTWLTTP